MMTSLFDTRDRWHTKYSCLRLSKYNRLVCENGGNCYTDTGHEDVYLDESTLVDDGSGDFQCKGNIV